MGKQSEKYDYKMPVGFQGGGGKKSSPSLGFRPLLVRRGGVWVGGEVGEAESVLEIS